MSTIELVDPELRDALALWPQVSLTAETLTRRRADALALLSSVPTPDLPDIATGEIHVETEVFICVLFYPIEITCRIGVSP
jgi:hypothetical protein